MPTIPIGLGVVVRCNIIQFFSIRVVVGKLSLLYPSAQSYVSKRYQQIEIEENLMVCKYLKH